MVDRRADYWRQPTTLARANERPRLTEVPQPNEAPSGRNCRSSQLSHPHQRKDKTEAEQPERRSKKNDRVRQPVRHAVEPVEDGSQMPGAGTRRAPRRDTDTAESEGQESKAQNKSRLRKRGPFAGDQKRADAIERVAQDGTPKDEPT